MFTSDMNHNAIISIDCRDMICNKIGDDWKRLASYLHLEISVSDSEVEESSYENMKKCFESVQNRITWKEVCSGLQNLQRHDIVKKAEDETNLTLGKFLND